MSLDNTHNPNRNISTPPDDIDDFPKQLDRALRPAPVAMPKEFEAQVAALGTPRVSQPVVHPTPWPHTAVWRFVTHPLATAAGVLLAAGIFWTGWFWYAQTGSRPGPPMITVPDPNRQWSNDLWDRGDTLGELRHQYADPAAELWLGREVYASSLDTPVDDIPRIFDAPRRGMPLSDSVRQLGLE